MVREAPDNQAVSAKAPGEPRILERSEHPISRRDIDKNAVKVLYRLNSAGYSAYLVGGSVRDLMSNDVVCARDTDEVHAVAQQMSEAHVVGIGGQVEAAGQFRCAESEVSL